MRGPARLRGTDAMLTQLLADALFDNYFLACELRGRDRK